MSCACSVVVGISISHTAGTIRFAETTGGVHQIRSCVAHLMADPLWTQRLRAAGVNHKVDVSTPQIIHSSFLRWVDQPKGLLQLGDAKLVGNFPHVTAKRVSLVRETNLYMHLADAPMSEHVEWSTPPLQ